MESRGKTTGWIQKILSIAIILTPFVLMLTLTSGQPPPATGGHATSQQMIQGSFGGLAAILLLILVPICYVVYRGEKKRELR
ncbi:MAG: hypothetical protein JRN39_02580 [Nitrososphaerota archaeon]|nr:hypothetical protein [Nitrososphaerota archaeon]MDG6939268.1 hypothetical protein [Nitrososphaerota archaeon]